MNLSVELLCNFFIDNLRALSALLQRLSLELIKTKGFIEYISKDVFIFDCVYLCSS